MELTNYFINPGGLWWGLSLLVVILLYLLRPKPRKQVIPSLMFLMGERGKKHASSFFRYLARDSLLLIHLLILLALTLAIANPYLESEKTSVADDVVIVLDNSASMYTIDGQGARYESARRKAIDSLGRKNTIILADSITRVVKEDVSLSEAKDYLLSWEPSHASNNFKGALQRAQEIIGDSGSSVVIISDFQDNDDFVLSSIAALKALGGGVKTFYVGSSNNDNVGFVDADFGEKTTTLYIKNYRSTDVSTTACINDVCEDITILSSETKPWSFSTPTGKSIATIKVDDALSLDDTVYISTDSRSDISVLVVSNDDFSKSSLNDVLSAIELATPLKFSIKTNTPPALTDVKEDLIIFYNVDPDLVVSRTIRQAKEQVEAGSAAVILYDDEMFSIPYEDLLPFSFAEHKEDSRVLNTNNFDSLRSIDYTNVDRYAYVTAWKPVTALAVSDDGTPIIAMYSLGNGRVLYYGISDEYSAFRLDPSYPLFWKKVLDTLLKRQSISELNKPAGSIISSGKKILTPDKKLITGTIILDKIGFYEADDFTISANLLSLKESNIATDNIDLGQSAKTYDNSFETAKSLVDYMILFVLLMLLLEAVFINWRGDI